MEGVDRIKNRDPARPFWLHVAFQAVHGGQHREATDACDVLPTDTNNRPVDGYRNGGYGNALHSLDHGVKNITGALKDSAMWANTILWLSADNGGDNPGGTASNYPLVGRKCLSWEGGTRTFAFLAGGLIPPARRGTVNDQLMHVSDWYVTFSSMAGVDPTDDWTDPDTGVCPPRAGRARAGCWVLGAGCWVLGAGCGLDVGWPRAGRVRAGCWPCFDRMLALR